MDETNEQGADPAPPHAPAQSPLAAALGWRGPAVWMACGALFTALVGSGAILAHRVSVERDMEQLARSLPPMPAAAQLPGPGPDPGSAPAPAPATAAPVPASTPADSGPGGEAAPALPPKPVAAGLARRMGSRTVTVPPRKPRAKMAAKPARQAPHLASVSTAKAAKPALSPRSPRSPQSRRRAKELQIYYSEIFRRCPQPGDAGAVECRRHICNGAESEGPACKPYRSGRR